MNQVRDGTGETGKLNKRVKKLNYDGISQLLKDGANNAKGQ